MSEDGELAHSKRGPSGAHRWRRCPGSVAAEEALPEKVGREAAEGTVFHKIAALCLEFGLDPEDFPLGRVFHVDGYEIEYDADMAHYMRAGLDWIEEHTEPGDMVVIEQRVDISPWAGPGQFGTCDVAIVKFAKLEIIVFDWKYGKGVPVSPEKNDQCYLYGLGVWRDIAQDGWVFGNVDPFNIKVKFHIEQPRATAGGGTWDTTMAEVLAEGHKILEDATAAMAPNAPRIPGEKQCQFCRARGQCPEQQAYLLDVFGQKFDDIEERAELGLPPSFKDPAKLSIEVRSYILIHWKAFASYVKEIHALTMHDLRAGRDVPLVKVVAGKPGRRFYPDPQAATEKLIELVGEADAVETNPISPPAAEKLLGKKRFKAEMAGLVQQPPGKNIIVHIDDRRPALQDYASRFDDIPEEEDEDGEE